MPDSTVSIPTPSEREAAAPRAAKSERSRRYRARKRAGKLIAAVEIDELILAMLAGGTETDVETLRRDRAQLNAAAHRALRYYAKRFAQTGSIDG